MMRSEDEIREELGNISEIVANALFAFSHDYAEYISDLEVRIKTLLWVLESTE